MEGLPLIVRESLCRWVPDGDTGTAIVSGKRGQHVLPRPGVGPLPTPYHRLAAPPSKLDGGMLLRRQKSAKL